MAPDITGRQAQIELAAAGCRQGQVPLNLAAPAGQSHAAGGQDDPLSGPGGTAATGPDAGAPGPGPVLATELQLLADHGRRQQGRSPTHISQGEAALAASPRDPYPIGSRLGNRDSCGPGNSRGLGNSRGPGNSRGLGNSRAAASPVSDSGCWNTCLAGQGIPAALAVEPKAARHLAREPVDQEPVAGPRQQGQQGSDRDLAQVKLAGPLLALPIAAGG